MVAFTAWSSRNTDLIRKSLDALAFIAPISASLPAALTTGASGDLVALPSGFVDLGWVNKGDGITRGRKVDADEVESLGSATPTRRDITKVDTTVQVTLQESKRISLELYHGVAVAASGWDATTKEVIFTESTRPSTIFYRMLTIWTDLSGTDQIYGATLYPRVSVTDMDDLKVSDSGGPIEWKVTFTAYVDATAGFAVKHFNGGPGHIARYTAMGYS